MSDNTSLPKGDTHQAAGQVKRLINQNRYAVAFSAAMLFLLAAGFAILVSCGAMTSSPSGTAMSGQVTTTLTDPPTCMAPMGPFKNVWVTITKVTAHISATASDTDSGWQTLVDLSSNPRQIDLFTLASPTCVLTQLGSTTGLPPGNYQQIRVYLLSNSPASGTAVPSPNVCSAASAFNCVVTSMGAFPLLLSSEAQTGIKIPPGQISGGAISVQASQAVDLSIDFNACASILEQGNGGFRLKPTLRAGVVSQNKNAISGTVVVQGTSTGINGAIVLLEQPDSSVTPSIDRVKAAALTDSSGSFIFCPLPGPGPYDVVVAAMAGTVAAPVTYNPTIAFSVPMGTNLGMIPLAPEGPAPSSPATITGQVTTAVDSTTATTSASVTLSALQDAAPTGGSVLHVTIPVFGVTAQPPVITTTATPNPATPACPANTECSNFSLLVPGSNALVATYDSTAQSITFPQTTQTETIGYNVNAWDADCTTANATTPSPVAVTVATPTNLPAPLGLSGCPASM